MLVGCIATLFVGCGGAEDQEPLATTPAESATTVQSGAQGEPVDYSKGVKVPIPAAGYVTFVPAASPTARPVEGTPTPTPPPFTFSEKTTAVLIDTLESTPRTSARQIVTDYRDDPSVAEARYRGKPVVIQGTIKEAGRDSAGNPFVVFNAGRGTLRCEFAVISEPELLRLTPAGTNATVGTVEAFDPSELSVTARQCKLVLGY
ncbi:MAG: hypothetical protein HYY34_02530 [Chloroflexi bacterium]|nr:hypothetical protein [Chloroflexota bacterium]